MVCELIAVGTELLLGNIANTDAQMISQGLSDLGITVYFHTVVGDNDGRLREAVSIAKNRSDIIITTGGLGPTYDDMTKETLAACFGKKLVCHQPSAVKIEAYFQRIGRAMTPNNMRQAYLPEDCTVFDNDWGTAPGCAFFAAGKHVIMLPGPPRECLSMFEACAMPYLKALADHGCLVSRQIRIFGMGESAVEDKLNALMKSAENPTIAPYAKEGEVMLRVTAWADTEAEASAMTQPVVTQIQDVLGDYVYGIDVESLEQCVVSLFAGRSLTLAVAESCTGGLLGARITSVPGASAVFRGGVLVYCDEAKERLLGVDGQLLAAHTAVSEPVARAMSASVREKLGADIGLAITGYAGPAHGAESEVGTVFMSLSSADKTVCVRRQLGVDRYRVRLMASGHALDMARRFALGLAVV